VIVISDLLQNSAAQSHYRGAPDVAAALGTAEGAMLTDGRLSGVAVELILLQNPGQHHRQGDELQAFWREVFVAAGAQPTFRRF
jgi:hypothetical protein